MWVRRYRKSKKSYSYVNTKLYTAWCNMKARCYTKSNASYAYYGGRGIMVCQEWRNNFTSFRKWAICNGVSRNLTLDRINNDGNYSPNNCKWSSKKEQQRNKRPKGWSQLDQERFEQEL